jgi:N-acetylglucosamine malate deacetylase 2
MAQMEQTILAVFAHPDDETFLAGGSLAYYARQGWRVVLLCMTHGESGSNGTPPCCRPCRLAEVRQAELRRACAILGVKLLKSPALPDGYLAQIGVRHLSRVIGQYLKAYHPALVLTFGQDGLTGHPDHLAVCRATTLAFQLWADTQATLFYASLPQTVLDKLSWHLDGELRQQQHPLRLKGVRLDELDVALDIRSVVRYKRAALLCHRTQQASFARLTEQDWELLCHTEYFRRVGQPGKLQLVRRPRPSAKLEADLLASVLPIELQKPVF